MTSNQSQMFTEMFISFSGAISGTQRSCWSIYLFVCLFICLPAAAPPAALVVVVVAAFLFPISRVQSAGTESGVE